MLSISFKIISPASPIYQAAVGLRESILRQPLGLRFSAEELEHEKHDIQIVGICNNEVEDHLYISDFYSLLTYKRN